MKSFTLYFKRNLYFILSLVTVTLTVVFALTLLFVFDLGKGVAQTAVGFVYLGSYEESEYTTVLSPRIAQWQNTADYAVVYQEYEWVIDLNHFVFDVETTVDSIRQDKNNPAYFTLTEAAELELYNDITDDLSLGLIAVFDFDQLLVDLNQDMQLLKNRKTYHLKDYLDETIPESVIDTLVIDQIPLDLIAELTADSDHRLIIPANSRFYLIDAYKDTDISNDGLSIIASALQYLMVQTPVQGFIYQKYDVLPAWAEPGMNVRILKLNQYDFSFFNSLQEDLILEIEEGVAGSLNFTLKGYPFLTTYVREVVLGPTIHYQTTYIDNPTLNELTPGIVITDTETETTYSLTITPGVDGFITYYKRTITTIDGATTSVLLYYEEELPVDAVVEQNIVPKG